KAVLEFVPIEQLFSRSRRPLTVLAPIHDMIPRSLWELLRIHMLKVETLNHYPRMAICDGTGIRYYAAAP
ncbi:MAG: hypothetical protein K0R28_5572, partial [Paenibacillus sp.]|nr:hypothetical protein [Paenibacillus sp.]